MFKLGKDGNFQVSAFIEGKTILLEQNRCSFEECEDCVILSINQAKALLKILPLLIGEAQLPASVKKEIDNG